MFCCKSKMKWSWDKQSGKGKVKVLICLPPRFVSCRNPAILNTSYTMNQDLPAVVPKQVTAWYHYHEEIYSVTFLWPLSGTDFHRIIFLPQTVLKSRYFRIKRAYCIKEMLSPLLKDS